MKPYILQDNQLEFLQYSLNSNFPWIDYPNWVRQTVVNTCVDGWYGGESQAKLQFFRSQWISYNKIQKCSTPEGILEASIQHEVDREILENITTTLIKSLNKK